MAASLVVAGLVAKGETLSKIAARYLGDAGRWREIQSLNKITDPAAVVEGSVLTLPETGASNMRAPRLATCSARALLASGVPVVMST